MEETRKRFKVGSWWAEWSDGYLVGWSKRSVSKKPCSLADESSWRYDATLGQCIIQNVSSEVGLFTGPQENQNFGSLVVER